jgi:hypothetical protein
VSQPPEGPILEARVHLSHRSPEDRCQNIYHFRISGEKSLHRKACGKRRELPKAEVSEFILTVDSRGCVSEDLTLWEDFTLEVCVGEYFETPEA